MLKSEPISKELIEAVAAQSHEHWKKWVSHLLSKGELTKDNHFIISDADFVFALEKASKENFSDLEEFEKDSDRLEAEKYINIINNYKEVPHV